MAKTIKFKHTTEITAEKSAMEITEMLGHIGARKIQLEYDEDRNLIGMAFIVIFGSNEISYKLPVRWIPIFNYLKKEKCANGDENRFAEDWEDKLMDQARRSSWRIAHDWLKSQLAFIEFGIRRPEELFLADMIMRDGQTVGELFTQGKLTKMIEGEK